MKLSQAEKILAAHRAEFGDLDLKSWQWLQRLLTTNGANLPDISPGNQVKWDLIQAMKRIEPGAERGALVGFRELRRTAPLSKEVFDLVALDAARKGLISMHRHDYPTSLSPTEQAELVTDGEAYYVGCAIRTR